MLRRAEAEPVRLPRRSPNLNAFIERFIRSIKEDCLDRVIPLGESHLRELIGEYMAQYHAERPHQGLGGAFVQPSNDHAAMAHWSGGSDSVACSTITTEKPRETGTIQ